MSRIQTYNGRIRLVNGRVRKGCCCGPPPVVLTCSGYDFQLPQFMTVVFPSVTNGTCGTCSGRGGSRTMKLTNSIGTIACGPGGLKTCCNFGYTVCSDGSYLDENTPPGSCPPGHGNYWQLAFNVPIDGTSDITVAARLTPSCVAEIVWRDTTLPWQSNFMGFSASLALESSPTNAQCGGLSGTVSVTS